MSIIELAPAEIDTVSGGKKNPTVTFKVKGMPPKEVVVTVKVPYGPSGDSAPPPPPPSWQEQADDLRERNDRNSGQGGSQG